LRRRAHVDVNDDEACKNAIQERDRLDVQIKELQQTYHEKFMKVLPARKVFSIIKAEENFHRQAFRRAAKHDRGK
jgi:saccharopine dehydrogenase-like NADP-dependent oxidoreductase